MKNPKNPRKFKQGVYDFVEKKCSMAELKRIKRPRGGNPVILNIMARVMSLSIEEPRQFDFQEEGMAERFRHVCCNYVDKDDLPINVRRAGSTVYIYKIEKETK